MPNTKKYLKKMKIYNTVGVSFQVNQFLEWYFRFRTILQTLSDHDQG